MDKTALLKKIRALAEHGVGGEAENAEKLLARMMKKYGISEAELDEETGLIAPGAVKCAKSAVLVRSLVKKSDKCLLPILQRRPNNE